MAFGGVWWVFFDAFAAFSDSSSRSLVPGVFGLFSALNGQQSYVVEGSRGGRERRESDSQVFCHMYN